MPSVLDVARGELGYDRFADPDQGTKYGRWYAEEHGAYFGTTGVPYCAMFTSWCFAQAGASCAGLPAASTTAIKRAAEKAGRLRGSVRDAQPGDVLLFSWTSNPNDLDHTCICEANCGSYVQTIEGNVGGGKVQRRTRDWKYCMFAVIPDGGSEESSPEALEEQDGFLDPAETILAYDGYFGPLTVKYVQRAIRRGGWYPAGKYVIDGDFGYWTRYHLQKYLRYNCGTYSRNCDGDFGHYSVMALQQHLLNVGCYWYVGSDGRRHACEVDGSWGDYTTTAVQRAINAGVF